MFEGIDLFCGAGGTTTGVHEARIDGEAIAKVVACINHDPVAIESHKANHPEAIHFVEDIRHFNTKYLPKKNPEAYSFLWASLECTNFSNAKGGQPRDADSRTLAEHLYRYIDAYEPDYILIENVREFMAWGPLDANGKPVSRLKGRDYIKWVMTIKSRGYEYQWRLLNAADYGAYTSRVRYFGIFAKRGLPIVWPQATHAKKPVGHLKKWKPVREVLELEEKGESIFTRKKPLSENTLKRIYAGLVKYVANGDDSFIKKYFSGRPEGKVIPTDGPSGTITCIDHQTLVQPEFLVQQKGGNPSEKSYDINRPSRTVTTAYHDQLVQTQFLQRYYSGNPEYRNHPIDDPAGTVRTNNCLALVSPEFMVKYYGTALAESIESIAPTLTTKDRLALVNCHWLNGKYSGEGNHKGTDEPAGSLTCKDTHALIEANWLDKQYSSNLNHQDIERPAGTIPTNDKHNLVQAFISKSFSSGQPNQSIEQPGGSITTVPKLNIIQIVAKNAKQYLMNPQWGGNHHDLEHPSFTIIARMDKAPPYLMSTEDGAGFIVIYDSDSETMKKIKLFMAAFGIIDIKMRMLMINELKRIQGLGDDYVLEGTKTNQKKFIGNAVHPVIPKAMYEALGKALLANEANRELKTA